MDGVSRRSDGSLNELCLYRPPIVNAYRPFASMGRSYYDILESPVEFGAKTPIDVNGVETWKSP